MVAGGVVYLQDLDQNVYALRLATGKLRWEYQIGVPEKRRPGAFEIQPQVASGGCTWPVPTELGPAGACCSR